MNTDQTPTARISHRFTRSAKHVFDAWLDPEWLGQWMFGPKVREEEVLHLKVNPRIGGDFSFLVRRGELEIDHIGEYLEIERPRRLVFTWGIRQEVGAEFSCVTVEIEPEDEGCTLRIAHEMAPEWADFVDRAQTAWQSMAHALARALEGEEGHLL